MISEFNALSEKVSRLAAMTLALRQENAALRLQLGNLGVQHEELAERMGQAHLRLEAIMDKLPTVPELEAELEADPDDVLAAVPVAAATSTTSATPAASATPARPKLAEEKLI